MSDVKYPALMFLTLIGATPLFADDTDLYRSTRIEPIAYANAQAPLGAVNLHQTAEPATALPYGTDASCPIGTCAVGFCRCAPPPPRSCFQRFNARLKEAHRKCLRHWSLHFQKEYKHLWYKDCPPYCSPTYGYHPTCWRAFPPVCCPSQHPVGPYTGYQPTPVETPIDPSEVAPAPSESIPPADAGPPADLPMPTEPRQYEEDLTSAVVRPTSAVVTPELIPIEPPTIEQMGLFRTPDVSEAEFLLPAYPMD